MLEEYPVSFVNNSSLMVVGQLTCTVLWLLSLITTQLQNCLDIYNPKGRCTSVVSVVLLVIDSEKKACRISRFYDQSDRQQTGLLAFIHSGDSYVI